MRYKIGDTCPKTGNYRWDGYTDGTYTPEPTEKEKIIPLEKGETFPPIKSAGKGAYWRSV
jgi:hypothetical protein